MPSRSPSSAAEAPQASSSGRLRLPEAPYLLVGHRQALWCDADGEITTLDHKDAAERAREEPPILCHAPATARRLGCDPFAAFDLLELYAFVRPARFLAPTPRGLAQHFVLPEPKSLEESVSVLRQVAIALLQELAARGPQRDPSALGIAWTLARAGWAWGPSVLAALGIVQESDNSLGLDRGSALRVWERLPEWSDRAAADPAGSQPIAAEAARQRLAALTSEAAELRPGQGDYAAFVAGAFQARVEEDEPNLVLAEAGTGIGKTLGYLAPASLWSEANQAPVWISTYTRNLQHQIDDELARLFPEPVEKAERVVIRKGRENYLCLLNLQDAVSVLGQRPQDTLATALLARWAERSRDGDMVGGDFPGWLADLLGRPRTLGLTDRRGECIYSACQHYSRCYIERGVRQARHAQFVIANHALVMIRAALGDGEETGLASHYVFDEGHHLFDAADSAFAAHLTGAEAQELRRWLLGSEAGRGARSSRLRGLRRRVEDLVSGEDALITALEESLRAAQALPAEGWLQRLKDGEPRGPGERFLAALRVQVYAQAENRDGPYGLEIAPKPPLPEVIETGQALQAALLELRRPLSQLANGLAAHLDEAAETLDSDSRRRIDATRRGLERRTRRELTAWCDMLEQLAQESPPEVVDWFGIERFDGRDINLGFYRHWVDPTLPFAEVVLRQAQGAVITSATLTDNSGELERDWQAATARCGSGHFARPAAHTRIASPFDYTAQTKVFIINDVRKDDLRQVAAAYRELFLAGGGGALGLFTAISRLRAVHQQIAAPLEAAGLPLYAQHVDRLDTATLIEIFRAETESCLLGTDAVRDGIDVPGEALRLIVFDRVPWPRPDIRHKARRGLFGSRAYDDLLTRLKLKQAFGRLVRRGDDRGVFVLLDPMMPSRLLGAFPDGVTVEKLGLAEAVSKIKGFLSPAA